MALEPTNCFLFPPSSGAVAIHACWGMWVVLPLSETLLPSTLKDCDSDSSAEAYAFYMPSSFLHQNVLIIFG